MMPSALVIVGGGEHAGVVIDAARSCAERWHVAGFSDPSPRADRLLGAPYLGKDDEVLARSPDCDFVLGVGATGVTQVRSRIVERFDRVGTRWAVIAHESATISEHARLGPGVVVLAGAVINAGAEIGAHSIVNSGAIVEHDVLIGTFVHVAPRAVI